MKGKIKVLFAIGQFGTGGKERQLVEILKGLPKDQFETYLLFKNITTHYIDDFGLDWQGRIFSLKSNRFSWRSIGGIQKILVKIQPDLVVSMASTVSHFMVLCRILYFPHQFALINLSIRDAPPVLSFMQSIEAFLYSFYGIVVANSHAGLVAYKQDKKKGRFVLYNGFSLNRIPQLNINTLRNKMGLSTDSIIIVMVAAFEPRKDHKTLLRALSIVITIHINIQLILAGDGSTRKEIEKMAEDLNLSDHIIFLGNSNCVENYLKLADIAVLSSHKSHGEGIPNAVLESSACGTCTIATKSGGTEELIIDAHTGYLFESGSAEALAEKLDLLIRRPALRKKMGKAAAAHVKKYFSVERMIQNIIKIFSIALSKTD